MGNGIFKKGARNDCRLLMPLLMAFSALVLSACDKATPSNNPAPQLAVHRLLGSDDQQAAADDRFERAREPAQLQFPRDHGAHPKYRSEWWYLTLMLHGEDGQTYGGQFTLFRQAQNPGPLIADNPWQANHVYMAHLAVTDVSGGQHYSTQRFGRSHPALAGVALDDNSGFRAWLDGWELASTGQAMLPLQLSAQAHDPEADFGWTLTLDSTKPLVRQGINGYSAKGAQQASYYYSFSRLQVQGELRLGDERVAVRGGAWLDHEWSTSVLSPGQHGWDWLAIQLAGGEEIMAFRMRREDGARDGFDAAVYIDTEGVVTNFDATEFKLRPTGYWRDEVGVCWPIHWQLQLPHGLYEVTALLDDQRMQTAVRYWEGLMQVSEAGSDVGLGYLELTGYQADTRRCE